MRNYFQSITASLSIFIGVFTLVIVSNPGLAAAATGNGFRVSPPLYELTVKKGTSQTVSIFVENLSDLKVTAKPIVNDFVANDKENGQPQLILDPNKSAPEHSFKPLVVPISNTTIAPLERKEIKVTLKVPATASPGGYYGTIRFQPTTTSSGGGSSVNLTASVGTLFLITVPGNLTQKLTLASFGAAKNGKTGTFFNSGPISLQTRLHNVGNIHVQPFGKILLKNTFGKVVYTTELNNTDPRGNILPNSIRKFDNPIGLKHLFGRYTAEGTFAYGDNGNLITVKKTFYVIPYILIIIVLLVLAFLIFGLPRLVRAYNRRVITRANNRPRP